MRLSRRRVLSAVAAAAALGSLMMGTVAFAQTRAEKPLKIVVYGGSGNIGSRIVAEAASRGHTVTVVDRTPKPIAGPHGQHVKLVTGDALDPKDIAKNIAGQDVVISSVVVRPAPMPDFALRVAKSMVEGLRTQTGTQKTRLLIVGGASSLYNAEGKRIIDTFPAGMLESSRGEVRSAVDALDWLKTVNDVSWTFFSPAMNITPGTRTGKFRLGSEQIVVDAQGRSAISMEDYAVAMLDEVEQPKNLNKRFTAGY
jgi:putative NADH-flavin reductase